MEPTVYALIAEALGWVLADEDVLARQRAYNAALVALPHTEAGRVLLHDLAVRLVQRADGPNDEGGRRLALYLFEAIATARGSLRE